MNENAVLTSTEPATARESFPLRPDALPPDRRRAAEALRDELVAAKDRSAERFLSADLLELLLFDSEAALPDDPGTAEKWAGIAVCLAGKKAPRQRLADDHRVRALRLRANALRLLRRFREAQGELSDALNFLAADSCEKAPFHLACGLLQNDLRNPQGALAHLHEAARAYFRSGAQAKEGTCRLLAGLVSVAAGDDNAHFELLAGWERVDPAWHPRLSRVAGFTLVRLAAEVAPEATEANRKNFNRALALSDRIHDEDIGERLQARRLEAAARARLGQAEAAEEELRDVFQKEIDREYLIGSTLAALHLSCVLKQLGQGEQWTALIEPFDRLDDEAGRVVAQETVRSFWADLREGWGTSRAALRAEAEFHRMCRLLEVPPGDPFVFA